MDNEIAAFLGAGGSSGESEWQSIRQLNGNWLQVGVYGDGSVEA